MKHGILFRRPAVTNSVSRPGVTVAVVASLILAGCAAGPQKPTRPQYLGSAAYHLLMAEIADRRSAYPVAAGEYVNAAERGEDAAICQRATEFALEYGYEGLALRAARRWAQVAPDSLYAQRSLARLLLARGEVVTATAAALKSLPPAERRTDEDYLGLAGALGESGNEVGITKVLARIARASPPSAGLSLALAAAALGSGDSEFALAAGREAAARSPSPGADALVARALLAMGQPAAALALLRESASGGEVGMLLERVRLLAAADQQAEAVQEITALAARYPDQPEVTRLRAYLAMDAGDMKTAWEQFGALLTAGRYVPEALYSLGQIAERQALYDDALRFYDRVSEGPLLLPALAAILRIAEKNGDGQSALDRTEEFARNHPRYALDSLRYRAAVLGHLNRYDDALQVLGDAVRYRPDSVTLRLARSEVFDVLGRTDEALADLSRAVALAPDSATAMNSLGYTLANRTRRTAEAFRLIRRALELEPANPAIIDSLGWVYYRMGRLPEARSYLQAAYAGMPDAEVAAHLGEVMWRQGQRAEAGTLWKDALERSPNNKSLQDTMARFH